MKPAFLEAISQLKQWIAANAVTLEQPSRHNGTLTNSISTLRFNAQPLSEAQVLTIQKLSAGKLPATYDYWLREVGSGAFFIDEYHASFDIFGPDEIVENQKLIAQEISEADEPIHETFFMIGVNNCMGDWMGFCTSRPGPDNYEVFNHEAPIDCYAQDAFWKDFEDWVITAVHSKGRETL